MRDLDQVLGLTYKWRERGKKLKWLNTNSEDLEEK